MMHQTFFLFSLSPFLLCRDHELTPAEKGILLHAQVYWYKTASNPLSFMLFGHFSLQKNCDFEIRENEAEQERLQGTAIVYGEKVQVRVGNMESSSPWNSYDLGIQCTSLFDRPGGKILQCTEFRKCSHCFL